MTQAGTLVDETDRYIEALRTMRCPTCGAVLTEYASPKQGEQPADVRTFFCGSHGDDPFVVSMLRGVLESLGEGEA